jgi:hypothetical protein
LDNNNISCVGWDHADTKGRLGENSAERKTVFSGTFLVPALTRWANFCDAYGVRDRETAARLPFAAVRVERRPPQNLGGAIR